jgi:hypothetical protein
MAPSLRGEGAAADRTSRPHLDAMARPALLLAAQNDRASALADRTKADLMPEPGMPQVVDVSRNRLAVCGDAKACRTAPSLRQGRGVNAFSATTGWATWFAYLPDPLSDDGDPQRSPSVNGLSPSADPIYQAGTTKLLDVTVDCAMAATNPTSNLAERQPVRSQKAKNP